MKKNIFLLMILSVFVLTGCGKKDQMTNFIPTVAPSEEDSAQITVAIEENDSTPTPEPVYTGETTTKYVKMTEYGEYLNVRSAPSADSEKVGFLVHTDKIEVMEIVDGWASFMYKDAVCYVNSDYLVDEMPDYIDPPTPTVVPESDDEATTTDSTGPDI